MNVNTGLSCGTRTTRTSDLPQIQIPNVEQHQRRMKRYIYIYIYWGGRLHGVSLCTTPCINRVIKFLSRCLRSATTTTSTTATTATTTITTTNNATAIRNELLDLVTNMRGEASELRRLEDSINALEATYVPCHTVTFLNHVMMPGTWQFRFSSRYLNRTTTSIRSPSFRLRDFYQHCVTTGVSRGNVTHTCRWEWNPQPQPQPQPQP